MCITYLILLEKSDNNLVSEVIIVVSLEDDTLLLVFLVDLLRLMLKGELSFFGGIGI